MSQQTQQGRPDASMNLLVQLTENPLDPGYEAAAQQRAASPGTRRSPFSTALVGLLAVLVGLGVTMAVSTLRAPTGVRNQARELLISQIVERRDVQEGLVTGNAELVSEISALSAQQLAGTDPALLARLEVLSVASGVAPVSGQAMIITLNDSEQAQDDPGAFAQERVQAVDLQVAVNALWAAGAEAIAVNGTRVGAAGAIRGAGQAILVDLVPVNPPYEIVAVGPVTQLRDRVAASSASNHFALLRDRYHIGVSFGSTAEAWLPGSTSTQLRFAEAAPTPSAGQTGSDTTDPEGEEPQ